MNLSLFRFVTFFDNGLRRVDFHTYKISFLQTTPPFFACSIPDIYIIIIICVCLGSNGRSNEIFVKLYRNKKKRLEGFSTANLD